MCVGLWYVFCGVGEREGGGGGGRGEGEYNYDLEESNRNYNTFCSYELFLLFLWGPI